MSKPEKLVGGATDFQRGVSAHLERKGVVCDFPEGLAAPRDVADREEIGGRELFMRPAEPFEVEAFRVEMTAFMGPVAMTMPWAVIVQRVDVEGRKLAKCLVGRPDPIPTNEAGVLARLPDTPRCAWGTRCEWLRAGSLESEHH